MRKKIVGILVCTLMIFATFLPVATSLNVNKNNTEKSNNTQISSPNLGPLTLINFPPIGDTYIRKSWPSTNFEGDETLWVVDYQGDWTDRALLQFDISSIPSGSTINEAQICLFFYDYDDDENPYEIALHRVISTWSASTVTWDSPWVNPGGDFDPIIVDSIFLTKPSSPPGYVCWKVTDLVQQWVDGTVPNYGVLIKCALEDNGMPMKMKKFYSNDWTTGTERPYLSVDYTKDKQKTIDTPFLQLLKSFPNLFTMIQKIIQRIGFY